MRPALIHKYELGVLKRAPVLMPAGAQVLSVGCQGSRLVLWAKHCPLMKGMFHRYFEVRATGQEFKEADTDSFIGTVLMQNGSLVFHVFEVAP